MDEHTKDLNDYLSGFVRRWRLIVGIAATGSLITVTIAALLPASYRSTATILIEQQEMPADLVRSTISSFADQRIQVIKSQVMTRANLLRIVETYNLYPRDRATRTTDEILEKLTKGIKLDLLRADAVDPRGGSKATIAFTLTYEGETPTVAQRVTNELATLFLSQNIKTREQKVADTSTFLAEEAAKLSAKVSDVETSLARFKAKHAGRLPELVQLNMQMRERTDAELKEVDRQIRALEERQFYIESQLSQTSPILPVASPAGGERTATPEERLNTLRGQLANLTSVYSKDHPDVLKLRRLIESLERQVGASAPTRGLSQSARESPEPPAAKADNPAFIALQVQLEGIRTEVKSLRSQRPVLQAKLASFEQRLQQTPEVEREYLELTRDHEASLARYREIRTKQMTADIGQELEKDRKAERFSLIDPAQLPGKPSSPNRQAILLVGLMLSVGSGFGAAGMLEAVDKSIRGSKALVAAIDLPVLAVVPLMEDTAKARRKRLLLWAAVLATVGVLVLAVVLVHHFYMPLDILWYSILRFLERHVPALALREAIPASSMVSSWNA